MSACWSAFIGVVIGARALLGNECGRNEIADAGQEVGAHRRIEALAVVRAAGEKAEAPFAAERYQRDGADFPGIAPEQEFALRVAQLAAARLAGTEQRVERAQIRRVRRHDAQESAFRDAGRRIVTDKVGNSVTVGPFMGIKVDKKAPEVSCSAADRKSASVHEACGAPRPAAWKASWL